ncbi:Harbinger transposase-derived nuclease [Melia azedarach]|uniref:Harbinger transposase-derived nuclease n=1 Tax=Melia azedarach TaxID=155640 RepID=A0ACC1XBP8_MELAZ|nr:Harbinger transposase-derived nuclease [Melia azedarach]
MEVTPFPFLNQEEYSHILGLFSEMEDRNNNNNSGFNGNNNLNKRRRNDDDDGDQQKGSDKQQQELKSSAAWSDILTSIILLDEEEKREQEQFSVESHQDKILFDDNSKRKTRAMDEYGHQLQVHYDDLDVMDQLRTKRSRRTASAAATVAAAAAVSENDRANNPMNQSASTSAAPAQHRRLWVKNRSKDWWEERNHPDFSEEQFRRDFRMSKATFNMVCEELESTVMKKNTMLRDAIPVRQRVAVCIWRLATGEPLRVVSKRFGLGISTCHKLVLEVCSAIKTVLMPKFLQWPDEQKVKQIKEEFESISSIANVGGAMYTTHVPIIAPKISVAAYFNKRHTERNQKTSYSITVQGVVDPKGVFTDVCIGWPGSMPDDQVLERSALFQRANRGLLKDVWIVGNSGYPLMDWVLVPYTQKNLTWTQHAFNEKIGEIQGIAKESFARLKGRWACLQKRTEVKLQELPVILGACCVLHNICEMRNEVMDPELKFDLYDDEMIAENSIRSMASAQARDHIAHNLLHHGLAGTSFLGQ